MSDAEDGDSPALELSVIAVPLAGKKLVKKLHKVVTKAAASKILKRGVKEVVQALCRGRIRRLLAPNKMLKTRRNISDR